MDTDQSSNMLSSIQSEVAKYQMLIEEENQKLKRYKVCSLCFFDPNVDTWQGKASCYVYGRLLKLICRNLGIRNLTCYSF